MYDRKIIVLGSIALMAGVLGFVGYHVSGGTQPQPSKQAGDAELKKQLTLIQSSLAGARAELAALQAKLDAAEKQLAILQSGSANLDKEPEKDRDAALYQGKPARYWLEKLKDRDQATILAAMRALAAIGEVDHSVISTVIDSLLRLRTDEFDETGDAPFDKGAAIVQSMMNRVKLTAKEKLILVPHLTQAERFRPAFFYIEDPEETIADFKDALGPARIAACFLVESIAEEPQGCAIHLVKLTTDRNPHLRWLGMAVARELGQKAKAASPEIRRALEKKETRYAAAFVLAHVVGPESAAIVPALLEKGINQNTLDALKAAGPAAKGAIPMLIEFVNREALWGKVEAATILGGLGSEAKDAVPGTLKLLRYLETPRRGRKETFGSAEEITEVRKALDRMGYKQR